MITYIDTHALRLADEIQLRPGITKAGLLSKVGWLSDMSEAGVDLFIRRAKEKGLITTVYMGDLEHLYVSTVYTNMDSEIIFKNHYLN